jgi:hypothetical protein
MDAEPLVSDGTSLVEDMPKIGAGQQARTARKTRHAGLGSQRLLLAANRLRPLARRALMMARPEAVAMRARKP